MIVRLVQNILHRYMILRILHVCVFVHVCLCVAAIHSRNPTPFPPTKESVLSALVLFKP